VRLQEGLQQRRQRRIGLIIGHPQPCAVGPLDFDFGGGRAPGRGLYFYKVQGGWQRGGHCGGLAFTAPLQRMGREAQPFGDAGEGQHVGECNGLRPQRLGNPATGRGPALAPLGKLLGYVAQLIFCLRRGQ